MAYSYEVLKEKYKELQKINENIHKERIKDMNKKDRKIKELKKELAEYGEVIKEKNKRLKEKDLIIGELLGRGEKCIYQKK